jgi:retron-type reverse transcriptase
MSPIISKLFEAAVSEKFYDYFLTSDSQFGFKQHLSCSHVIYSVKNVVDQCVANGSTVNVCSLDLSKAFDIMNHYILLTKLIRRNLPLVLLNIMELWFKVSKTCVKWEGCESHFFSLMAGLRQGGVLSPLLFAIFIDDLVDVVRRINVGCCISRICCAIFLYAD